MTEPISPLRITPEDLAEASAASEATLAPAVSQTTSLDPTTKKYGNINTMPDAPALEVGKSSILLQAWFYLGLAGLLGALAGWGIAEPAFIDGPGSAHRWGNFLMMPLLVALMCAGFAVAESIVERSARKVLIRGGLALPLGMVLGFVLSSLADLFYTIALAVCFQSGVQSFHNPATWIARGLGWMVLGAAGGVVYGIIGQSMRKTGYGVLGGAIGAAIGGIIFDPIAFATNAGGVSRAVGFGLLGLATGVAMGLVESALKDRWLYVTAGPLAGKQFILYKPQTTIGSSQTCDIYLFKDPAILPHHGVLAIKASKVYLLAQGPAYISGQPVRNSRLLESGNVIQIGRYSFRYQERQRS